MNREDFVVTLFAEANPVPDPSAITLVDDGGLLAPTVAELSEKTHRSGSMRSTSFQGGGVRVVS